MFYMQYLSSLCQRRQWPQPLYEPYVTRSGIKCVVRVNHREYHTDRTYSSEQLATENAAMRAYLICRNFSVNDGRYPTGHNESGGVLQGMPVAIGTGRRGGSSGGSSGGSVSSAGSVGSPSAYGAYAYGVSYGGEEGSDASLSSGGSRSGGSSPGSAEFPVSYRTERRSTTTTGARPSRRR